ncbi:MAG: DUF1778 domain-containing protein [Lachnospiraceae bacterium]|nr:DUF1778 domain-containing protein [Lachnospiraceae bacterium]
MKDNYIRVRLSTQEKEKLSKAAAANNMTMSEFVLNLIRGAFNEDTALVVLPKNDTDKYEGDVTYKELSRTFFKDMKAGILKKGEGKITEKEAEIMAYAKLAGLDMRDATVWHYTAGRFGEDLACAYFRKMEDGDSNSEYPIIIDDGLEGIVD